MSAVAPAKIAVFNPIRHKKEGPSFAPANPLMPRQCPPGFTDKTKLVKNPDGSWARVPDGCVPVLLIPNQIPL
jgi:hypothetical protein